MAHWWQSRRAFRLVLYSAALLAVIRSAAGHSQLALGGAPADARVYDQRSVLEEMSDDSSAAGCGLSCWLSHLTVDVPDLNIPLLDDELLLSLSDMECVGLELSTIQAQQGPVGPNGTSIAYELASLDTKCNADWHLTGKKDRHGAKGELGVAVVSSSATVAVACSTGSAALHVRRSLDSFHGDLQVQLNSPVAASDAVRS
eukprot:TRINITY_DN22835_c0_g1_i1.p1 TRINITY_DN22835_c0_g1~~TRINITY_DN22835_c0_g1_i1.p1  ORF type:complete len:201 (+),score=35.27 TRINITY_DN22835_c0_g1_i1:151-753(+)